MGATPVPLNFRLAPPEIRYVLEDAACDRVVVDPEFAGLLDSEPLLDWRDRVISLETELWEQALTAAKPLPMRSAGADDEAMLLYTGGTSGRAKGVPLSHRNIVSNAMQVGQAWSGSTGVCTLHVAPMFHAADLVMTPFTINGATHTFLAKFTPELLFTAIQAYGVTSILLVPTMIMMVVESGIADDFDLSSWTHCIYGTAPMNPELIQRFMKAFPGVELAQGYGLTETSPLLTILDFETHKTAIESGRHGPLKSCGRSLPGVDLRIVDVDGTEVADGEAGELVARGPNVFSGYLNLPEENKQALRDGWFHTGDVGRLGDDDLYYLLDRKQYMIITGGENVYSNEVENILYQHPGVQEAAVIGIPDARYGETVTAVVVADPGSELSGEALREYCQGKIGNYKIPRRFEFVDELPKSAVGKILKRKLKELFPDG